MPLSTYACDSLGGASIRLISGESGPAADHPPAVEAGSFVSFELEYVAGPHGVDDSGSIKLAVRFASDIGAPQLTEPGSPNFVTLGSSADVRLEGRFDPKNNIRPWGRALTVRVTHGYLREGDSITVRFGDRSLGSPGIRMQTFCEDRFRIAVLVDAFATCDYVELPVRPALRVVAGPPARWVALLPSAATAGERFSLRLKAEDRWGNPTCPGEEPLHLRPSRPVAGLPSVVRPAPTDVALVVDDLSLGPGGGEGPLRVEVLSPAGTRRALSNPLLERPTGAPRRFWADFHGQSEETIGTNSAEFYFRFARDRAFLDVSAHQGNDFQITGAFWARLQELARICTEPGRFVVLPGYEWSGNTGLGGDHNVLFLREGEQIHRSCHALVPELGDEATDCHSIADLLRALRGRDVVLFAHAGGRPADVRMAASAYEHLAVEVHSAWGTFEWLLRDALEAGLRVGVVANSDDHKGRPGASYPGAGAFGTYGGLTCVLAPELTREAVFEALRARRHYATTGARIYLDVELETEAGRAVMGDAVRTGEAEVGLRVNVAGSAAIERVDLYRGAELLGTFRPFGAADLGRRVRVSWEGAENRGRRRETVWDGAAEVRGNTVLRVRPVAFWNPEKSVVLESAQRVTWRSSTTGNTVGFDMLLGDPAAGTLRLDTPVLRCELPVEEIGLEEAIVEGGGLGRRVRVYRLPEHNGCTEIQMVERVALRARGENALYVRVVQEDGHKAWSSPIYVSRSA